MIEIINGRKSNNTLCTFTKIPTTDKLIQLICLLNKTSIMKNILLPKVTYDNDLVVIISINPVKNSLILDLNIVTIRAINATEDVLKYKNISIVDDISIQKEINDLEK